MRPSSSLLLAGIVVLIAGCGRTSLKDLHEKNRSTIDTALASYAAMEQVIAKSPQPALNGACSRAGLVPVAAVRFSQPSPADRFGPTGDPNTELVDHADLTKRESWERSGLFESFGPLNIVVSDERYSKTSPDFKVDAVRAQIPYDEAKKVRHVLVARVNRRGAGEVADRADVYLFEHPKASLVCSFSIDASADRKLAEENGYDPHTGERMKSAATPGADELKRLFMGAIEDRFGITYPPSQRQGRRLRDDPRVTARASSVSRALDATPDDLRNCTGAETTGGARLNKKALRIFAGGPLLGSSDPNVRTDPNNSDFVSTYLRTRDPASAASLASAETWKVVDVRFGGPAASIDNRTFFGGDASGRQVVFDAANRAVCQTRFRLAAPETLTATTRSTAGAFALSDISERSASDLRSRIDTALGL